MSQMFKFQLYELGTGRALSHDGKAIVMGNGDPAKVAVTDEDGVAASNPVSIVSGEVEFYIADSVKSVDISIYTEYGYTAFLQDVQAGQLADVFIDTQNPYQTLIVPFSINDSDVTAASEYDSGIDLAEDALILPDGLGIKVATEDATETIDVGLDGTGAENDPNGLISAASVATAGVVPAGIGYDIGTNNLIVDVTGGDAEFTYGVLMVVGGDLTAAKVDGGDAAATDGNGWGYLQAHKVGAGADLTYTLTAGTDTAEGYIIIPQLIPFPAALS